MALRTEFLTVPTAREHRLGIGPSGAKTSWSTFLKSLVKRGLRGVKLVISDAHDALHVGITRVAATW